MKKVVLLALGTFLLVTAVAVKADEKLPSSNIPASKDNSDSVPAEPKTATAAPASPMVQDTAKDVADLKTENERLRNEIREMKQAIDQLRELQRGLVTKKEVTEVLSGGLKPIESDLKTLQKNVNDLKPIVGELSPMLQRIAESVLKLQGVGPDGKPIAPKEFTLVVRNQTGSEQTLLVDGAEWRIPALPQESLVKAPILRSDLAIITELWPFQKPKVRKLKEVNGRWQAEMEIFLQRVD